METITALHIAAYSCWVRRWTLHGHAHAQGNATAIAVYDDDRIVAVNGPLLRRGLPVGESLDRARALFPDAAFYPHDPTLDRAVWEDILYLLADISPRLRSLAPGWALLDPFDLSMLRALNRTLGGQLGVAPMSLAAPRFTAMLAALHAAPGDALLLAPKNVGGFHSRASIRHLAPFGFDEELIERLGLFGLGSIGGLMKLTRRHLKVQFGAVGGALHDLLHPKGSEPPIPLFQPPPTIAAEYTFEHPAVEPAELLPVLDHLLAQLAERLGALGAQLLTLRLSGGGAEGTRAARRLLKAPTARVDHLRVIARTLLDEMMRYSVRGQAPHEEEAEPMPVERMRLELGGLIERGGMQGGLFEHRPAVYEVVKSIHKRFPGRLVRAVITDPDAYIPESGVRFEPYPISSNISLASIMTAEQMLASAAVAARHAAAGPASPLPAMPTPTVSIQSGRIAT